MMDRIVLRPVPGDLTQVKLHGRAAVTFKDGRIADETVEHIYGNPGNPASWARIAEKFVECSGRIPEAQQQRVIALCGRLDQLRDIRDLASALGSEAQVETVAEK